MGGSRIATLQTAVFASAGRDGFLAFSRMNPMHREESRTDGVGVSRRLSTGTPATGTHRAEAAGAHQPVFLAFLRMNPMHRDGSRMVSVPDTDLSGDTSANREHPAVNV